MTERTTPQPYRDRAIGSSLPGLQRILVATLLDREPSREVELAAALARATGGSVCILHVLEALMYASPEMAEFARRSKEPVHPEASRKMSEAILRVTGVGVLDVEGKIEFGIPSDVIDQFAGSKRFDLLVVGTRGTVGTVLAKAIELLPIPVLVAPTVAP